MSLRDRLLAKMNPPVFLGSAALVIAFVVFGAGFSETAYGVFEAIQRFIVNTFGWFYVSVATGLLVFAVWLLVRHGNVRLGGADARPEFRYVTWFSMLLAAGMGIGIVFFGVAEPLQHYVDPPVGEGRSPDAIREAMRFTFFHWGFHPWAIYTAVALPLAYFHFRHGLPMAPRSLLYPLLGARIFGWPGHVVDILCTIGTLFGVATSLGLGAVQINAGIHALFDVPQARWVQLVLIASITAAATISVVTGLKGGIRALSTFNIGLAVTILLFVLVAGPTVYVLDLFVTSVGYYLQKLPETSLWVRPGAESGWQAKWTLFYWSWWISWSPFVGVFVARISKGRTVREFVLSALLVPTLLGFLWFAVVGGTGIHVELFGPGGVAEAAMDEVKGSSLFTVLEHLPWTQLLWVLATLLIIIFFVTSSDSGSLVDDMVTSGGHPNPPKAQRVFWAVSEGAVAATLLVAGAAGDVADKAGLRALRTASLTTGLPMALFLLVACVGLAKALRIDERTPGPPRRSEMQGAPSSPRQPGR